MLRPAVFLPSDPDEYDRLRLAWAFDLWLWGHRDTVTDTPNACTTPSDLAEGAD